jgi:hypothetical protein
MSSKIDLGRLERVPLRDFWEREDTGFTPWLASDENIAVLGDAIGFELEVQQEEANVGPFRADILCKDVASDDLVIIENQLERTDHGHLGQTLVYAAGLDAVTVIWIAERFTDEHRATLDWLNRITDENFSFFGLEIEVWRIGDSAPAPKFNLVAMPNNWSKSVKEAAKAGQHSPANANRIAYWASFGKYMEENGARFKRPKPYPSNWMGYGVGRSGAGMTIVLNQGQAYVFVQTDNWAHPTWYDKLEAQKDSIEAELGFTLEWDARRDKKYSWIGVQLEIDANDESNWPVIHEWMLKMMDAIESVMRPRVVPLDDEPFPNENE